MNSNQENENVVPMPTPYSSPGGNGGGGGGSGERLARLEERVKHLATAEALQKAITEIEKLRGDLKADVKSIKWMLAVVGGAFVLAVGKYIGFLGG